MVAHCPQRSRPGPPTVLESCRVFVVEDFWMDYKIVYQQSEGQSSEPWSGTLEEAKDQAINSVITGGSSRAEINDRTGQLVFEYPAPIGR